MTIFGMSNSSKDLGIPCLVKFKGVHEIVIGSVGQFQSVTKGVQTGSLDAQECDPCTYLISHADKTAQRQLEHHVFLVRHKVPHVLKEEEFGPVVIAVADVGGDERVLEL